MKNYTLVLPYFTPHIERPLRKKISLQNGTPYSAIIIINFNKITGGSGTPYSAIIIINFNKKTGGSGYQIGIGKIY